MRIHLAVGNRPDTESVQMNDHRHRSIQQSNV